MSALRFWDAEEWREFDGDYCGSVTAISFPGHIDPEEAIALTWAWLIDHYGDDEMLCIRRGGPRHTYFRKVPWHREDEGANGWDGAMQYVLGKPGPGAAPITYVEWATSWDWSRCHYWPRCHEPAGRGFPVSRFIDPPPDVTHIWYCRQHAREVDERFEAAFRERTGRAA